MECEHWPVCGLHHVLLTPPLSSIWQWLWSRPMPGLVLWHKDPFDIIKVSIWSDIQRHYVDVGYLSVVSSLYARVPYQQETRTATWPKWSCTRTPVHTLDIAHYTSTEFITLYISDTSDQHIPLHMYKGVANILIQQHPCENDAVCFLVFIFNYAARRYLSIFVKQWSHFGIKWQGLYLTLGYVCVHFTLA